MKRTILSILLFLLLLPQAKANSSMEVAGAVGNIAVNTQTIDPNSDLGKAVNIYNAAMGVIGVKNVGKGVVNFAKELPEQTRNLLRENKSVRDLITAKYLDYRIAITNLKAPEASGIPAEYRALMQQQDEVFSLLTAKLPINFSNAEDLMPYLKTESNQAFFWSGRTNGIGGAEKAEEIARSKGGTTLEMLVAKNNINMPEWKGNEDIWDNVSEVYAKNAKGEIYAIIGSSLREKSTWIRKELPALKNNQNVMKIIQIDPETLIETIIFTR